MISIKDKSKCCGCTACMAICPKKCITMFEDEEGFEYPRVDESKCVNCQACEHVCPTMNLKKMNRSDDVCIYGCQNMDNSVRAGSTSGGIFGALANEILDQKGTIWAVGFDDNAIVCHKQTQNRDELADMFGSKYVQSSMGNTFSKIKYELNGSKDPILFVGTPCQVEGLLHIITPKERERLYTVDLVCYGVPSPGLYRRWVDSIQKHHGKKVKRILFRDKKYGYSGVNVKVILENGIILEDSIEVKTFGKIMFSHIGLRPICYNCPFRGINKSADFTLGDMWEIGLYDENMDDDLGTTNVQVHTEKGRKLFNKLNGKIKICEVSCLNGNELADKRQGEKYSLNIPVNRDQFFCDAQKLSYEELVRKYLPTKLKEWLGIFLKPIIVKLPFSRIFFRTLKQIRMKVRKM